MYVVDNTVPAHAALPGLDHQTLAGSMNGLKDLSVWRQTIAAGAATPPHRHDCEEVVVVTSGSGELHIAGGVHAFGANNTLIIPRNVDHQIINSGDVPMNLLATLSMTPVEVLLSDGEALNLPWES